MPLPAQKSNSFLFNSFYIFTIRFFPSLANLLILLYYSRNLNKEIYGAYQNFWIQLFFISPLVCVGLHTVIITYAPSTVVRLLKALRSKQLAVYGLWIALFGAVFGVLQFRTFQGGGFLIAASFLVFFAAGMVLEAFLVLFRQYRLLCVINFVYAASYLSAHVVVLRSGFSFHLLFLTLLGLNALKVAVFATVAYRCITRYAGEEYSETRSTKEIRTLWLHVGFNDILQAFSSWVDKFIVSVVLTASLSAVYYNGAQNIPFLSVLLSAAGSSVLMQMVTDRSGDERSSLLKLMQQSGRYGACVVLPLFFFLLFFRYDLFETLLPGYMASVPVFLISLLILPLRAYSFFTVFQKLHKGHIANIGAVAELVIASLLMYPLYLFLGLPGVALSFIISTYIQVAYYIFHMSRLFDVAWYKVLPLKNWLSRGLVYAAVFFTLHYFMAGNLGAAMSLMAGLIILVIIVVASLSLEHKNAIKNGIN